MAVYLLAGQRTPIGSFMGGLSQVSAPKLGATAIKGAIEKANIDKALVDEVLMGNVIQAGVGQAPARQASIFSGLSESVQATTINKVCGSGLKTIISGAQAIKSGDSNLVISGGMENMSLAPHLLIQSRMGIKFGDATLRDSMQWDGLWDVYSDRPMGNCAEECVREYGITRQQQDEFSMESFKRSQNSVKAGDFQAEISQVIVPGRKGDTIIKEDEGPFKANFEKMPSLRPAFEKEGTITAANASTINDGAAAIVIGGDNFRAQAKFKIRAYAAHAQNPTWFTTAPVEAMKKSLEVAKLSIDDIDLFEINEAFAIVTLAAMKELNLDHNKVNVMGGAVSLGHPIGCSGARIVVTLMNALEKNDKNIGMASICIGGGEALSLIIERV